MSPEAIKGHHFTGLSPMTATEYVVLVDKQDQPIGLEEKLIAHQKGLLHRAFSVFIFRRTPQLELLIHQRALHKYHSAGLWTNTCCSHPRSEEPIIAAGERRLVEEMGIKATLRDVGSFHYIAHFDNGLSENELDHVLIGETAHTTAVQQNPNEVRAYRWITPTQLQIELAAKPELFTPWFAEALTVAMTYINTLPAST
jgi:isopentenyl-diphosphate delta-isomerase type 1